ncbi:MAG: hypothetical protein RJB01_1157 [Actinomycetota bacterium]
MSDFESIRTRAVHAGRDDFTDLGVHTMPIDLSTTNPLTSISAGRDAYDTYASGATRAPGMTALYRRAWNPTVARFENAIAALEGYIAGAPAIAVEALAYPSGMAAITAVLQSRVAAGKPHILAIRPLYGGTDAILASGLLGTEVQFVDPEHVAAAVTNRTGLVVLESPSNPTLELRDIAHIARVVGDVPVMVDNTFATPVLQRPLTLGAGYVVHSATKYIGGHGDAMGGVVVTSAERAAELRPLRVLTGSVMDPFTAYLMHRGLATLPIRVRAAQETAQVIAEWLTTQSGVTKVFYPGLTGADPQGLLRTQMDGPGAMVAFDVHSFERAEHFCQQLRLITHAVSLGGVDTLIEHPAALTHRVVAEEAQPGEGILRLAIGLESAEDLIADLSRGTQALH